MAKTKAASVPKHTTELSPAEYFALLRAAKPAEKLRDQLKPGSMHQVDVEIRVQGMVSVGVSTPNPKHEQPDLVGMLGLILDCLPTAERAKLEKKLNVLYAQDLDGEWPQPSANMHQVALACISRWTRTDNDATKRGAINATVQATVVGRH